MNTSLEQTAESLPHARLDLANISRGLVCFTFDDAQFRDWLRVLPLFRMYHAHATFFYSGALEPDALESMRTLRAEGHSIGLHSLHHGDAVNAERTRVTDHYTELEILPQLDILRAANIPVDLFAYPNNRRNDESDRLLAPFFRHFRAGLYPSPKEKNFRIAEQSSLFIPFSDIAERPALVGAGIGEFYGTTWDKLDEAMEKAARENVLLVFFSHGIHPDAKSVHMPVETLEHCLAKASELGLTVAGMDELP